MKSVLAILCLCAAVCGAEKPNIVFILADDYGYGSAGCYGADAKLVRTPNIDRLAREGRRFTDACAPSSVCSPTRYAVLTGRYCWRTPLKHEVLGVSDPLWIETNRVTVASLVKRHGYATAAIGKWHLGYGTTKPVDFTAKLRPGPQDVGFDYHFGVPSNHGDNTGIFVDCESVAGLRSTKLTPAGKCFYGGRPFMGLDAPQRDDPTVMETLTDKAVAWIGQQKRDKPFFLYFTPVAVHEPITPSVHTKGSSKAGPYGDWIHDLDRSVGRILEALPDNTLVIFTSDNGGENKKTRSGEQLAAIEAGLKMNGPWRAGKHSIYEGGFRVPYLVRWPGHVPAGTVCDETINLADTLATTAALLGEKPVGEDSYNVLSAWLGEKHDQPLRRDMILHSADGVFAIRRGPWKYIEGESSKPNPPKPRQVEFEPQLYNLADDPAETKNVIAAHPDIAKELAALIERYRDGGYSRELPPVVVKTQPVVELPPLAANKVFAEPLDKIPGERWVQVRGKWTARDGAVWGAEKSADKAPAALRHPLAQTDGDIQYELSLPRGVSHTLRLACKERDHVVHVQISTRKIIVTNLSNGKVLAESPVRLAAQTWLPVRACFRGNDLFVQVGDAAVKASAPLIGEPKTIFSLLVNGENIGFRKVVVHQP